MSTGGLDDEFLESFTEFFSFVAISKNDLAGLFGVFGSTM